MKAAFVSLVASLLIVVFIADSAESLKGQKRSKVQIPEWLRLGLRRRRARQGGGIGRCDNFVNRRCAFGMCYLRPGLADYPDNQANFTNQDYGKNFQCSCIDGYETYYEGNTEKDEPTEFHDWCNAEIDPCRMDPNDANDKNPCQSRSMENMCLHTGPNDYECVCTKFWTGAICQTDVNECAPCQSGDETSCPCKNGAQCRNAEQNDQMSPLGFNCYCEQGTSGQFCEKINNPCLRMPCIGKISGDFGGAEDSNPCKILPKSALDISRPETLSGYKCSCKVGWGGLNCQMLSGDCSTDPCGDRGSCFEDPNFPNFYLCRCFEGYENDVAAVDGNSVRFCTKEIDQCLVSPTCKNNATCISLGPNARKCVCQPGWTGPNCESLINPCYSPDRPKCLNGGKCKRVSDSGTAYTCECDSVGFHGLLCQNNTDECSQNNPCQNGASCVDKIGSYECLCAPGFINTGMERNCSTVETLCNIDPGICRYNGRCEPQSDVDKNFECDCDEAFAKYANASAVEEDATGRCTKPNDKFWRLDLSTMDLPWVDPDEQSAYLTRQSFLKLNDGGVRYQTDRTDPKPEPVTGTLLGDGWMILYFKSPVATDANLMTIWERSLNRTLIEIVPTTRGKSFILKFYTTTEMKEVRLPQFSMKGWNNIMVRTIKSPPTISVYFNTVLIEKIESVVFESFTNVEEDIIFGSAVDGGGEMTGPYFSGAIADLFWSRKSPFTFNLDDLMNNFLRMHADPGCKPYLDLRFEPEDVYSDSGCTRFDAVPIMEEVFSEWEQAPNGVYPLARFAADRSPSAAMARLQTTANGTRMLVPNFKWLFQPDMEFKYGMMFRFQLNEQGNEFGNRTFLRSARFFADQNARRDFPENQNVLEAGTMIDDEGFKFVLTLTTDAEEKTMEAILDPGAQPADQQNFCKDCVWSVAVNWDATADKGSAAENIHIYTMIKGEAASNTMAMVEGNVRKTTYSIQGKIDPDSVSPLVFGVDRAHQVGQTRFLPGKLFADDEIRRFVRGQDRPMPPPSVSTAMPMTTTISL